MLTSVRAGQGQAVQAAVLKIRLALVFFAGRNDDRLSCRFVAPLDAAAGAALAGAPVPPPDTTGIPGLKSILTLS
jgi:hypothetical protein